MSTRYTYREMQKIMGELGIHPVTQYILTFEGTEWRRSYKKEQYEEWLRAIPLDKARNGRQALPSSREVFHRLLDQGYVQEVQDLITGLEVIKIYTWRSHHEYGMPPDFSYGDSSARHQVLEGALDAYKPVDPMTGIPYKRRNYYKVKDAFSRPLAPRRAASVQRAKRKLQQERSKPSPDQPPIPSALTLASAGD